MITEGWIGTALVSSVMTARCVQRTPNPPGLTNVVTHDIRRSVVISPWLSRAAALQEPREKAEELARVPIMSLIKSLALTPAKLAANRANARRSTGPRTPRGRQRTRLNALKHGLRSRSFASTVVNSAEDRKKFRQGMVMLSLALVPAGSAARKLTEKLARMMWTRSCGAGPNGRQPFFLATRRELVLLARVAQVCKWWYADEAAYAPYAGEPTNPQCPLESTDRNFDASLFPFQWRLSRSRLRRIGKAMAKRVLRFADQLLLYAMYQRTHNVL